MNKRLAALNVLLVAVPVFGGWWGWTHWREAEGERQRVLGARVPKTQATAVSPVPAPAAPQAVKYVDVASRDLFTIDRNPTVIVPAPPVVEKPKVMPPLPRIYGVLGLPSGVTAMMSEQAGLAAKTVRAGDKIGEFEIARIDHDDVTFVWDGKEIKRKVEELMDRQHVDNSSAAAGPAAPPPPAPNQPQAAQMSLSAPVNPSFGVEIGAPGHSELACKPGDSSPEGTVVDGRRKVITPMPFGNICRWVPVQ